jgi:hypothetical protein
MDELRINEMHLKEIDLQGDEKQLWCTAISERFIMAVNWKK